MKFGMLCRVRERVLTATVLAVAVFACAVSGFGAANSFAAPIPLPIDPAFNGGAELPMLHPNGTPVTDARDVSTLPDGRIIVLTSKSVLAFDPSGKLDPTFGTGGEASIDLGGKYRRWPADKEALPNSIRTTPAGNILIIGVRMSRLFPTLLQLTPNGTIDRSFGSRGVVVVDHSLDSAGYNGEDETRVAFRRDGTIVVASEGLKRDGVLFTSLLDRRGKMQMRFGTRGVARVAYKSNFAEGDWLGGVTIDRRGRVVLAGYINESDCLDPPCAGKYLGSTIAFAARLNSRGRLDRSFSRDGVSTSLRRGCIPLGIVTLPGRQGLLIADDCQYVTRLSVDGKKLKRWRGKTGATAAASVDSGAPETIHRNPDGSFNITSVIKTSGPANLTSFALRGFSTSGFLTIQGADRSLSNSPFGASAALTYDTANHPVTIVNRKTGAAADSNASFLARYQ